MAAANPGFSSTFKTIDSRKKYLSDILKNYNEGSSLNETDSNNVKDFYQKYYTPADDKKKCDISEIDNIKVETNEYFEGNKPTKCLKFYFKNMENDCIISKKLLVGHSSKDPFRSPAFEYLRNRFRNLIIPQVVEKKINEPDPDPSRNIADHEETFEKLFRVFIKKMGLENFNNSHSTKEIDDAWIKFHKENAVLTLMSESEHKKKTDDDSKYKYAASKRIWILLLIKFI